MRRPAALLVIAALLLVHCDAASPAPAPVLTQVPGVRAKIVGVDEGGADLQLVFDPHAEIVKTLEDFAEKNEWRSLHFMGLGACSDAIIGYYDLTVRAYEKTALTQQMEIVSLVGDAAKGNANDAFHAHIALGFADGTLHGGHLFEAHALPTLELFVRGSHVPMTRRHDETSNLELLVP